MNTNNDDDNFVSDEYRDYNDSCYGAYPPDEFEGLFEEHSNSGQLIYRGYFQRNNKRIGQHLYFWENGNLREVSFWIDGWVTGVLIRFNEDGSRDEEIDFGVGGNLRNYYLRSYGSESAHPTRIFMFKDGMVDHIWRDQESQRLWDLIGGDNMFKKQFEELERMKMEEDDEDDEEFGKNNINGDNNY